MDKSNKSGAEALLHSLHLEGVELMFGYPGGAALHIYDAIFNQDHVDHILVRHEQGAVHAADGYARATGKPGVALVTSGPGATNAITGLATAYMDSTPVVVISGQVKSNLIGTDSFQETDMIGVSRPIVKHSFLVQRAEDIPEIVKKAFHIATTGRPGPVVIDVPKDLTDPDHKFEFTYPSEIKMRSYNPPKNGDISKIKEAVDLIEHAKRPVIYSGGGVIQDDASDELTELARLLNFPVTNTLMGLGAFPGSDPQFMGMLGMHGTYQANMAMHNADLIVAVGARFDDRITNDPNKFSLGAKKIHIDVDAASVSKIIHADVPIVGSAKECLSALIQEIKTRDLAINQDQLSSWNQQISEWREAHGLNHSLLELGPQNGKILQIGRASCRERV